MKVIFVTREPFPVGMAATNRIICLAKAYQSAGVDCRVLIFSSCAFKEKSNRNGVIDGIPYEYLGETKANNSLLRRLSSLKARFRLFRFLKNDLVPGDYVYGYYHESNAFTSHVIYLVHKSKAYYISELCELPYGTGAETKKKRRQRNYALKHVFPKFDGVLAISTALKELAVANCNPRCTVIRVPILVDYQQYALPDMSSESEHPYIFHSGTLYEQKDGVLGMIEAFGKALQRIETDAKFVMTGLLSYSPHEKEIKELIERYHLQDRIIFTGYLSKDELKQYLSKASLVIINKYPSQQNEYCFSTKLGEYLAAGKPLIVTRVGEVVRWVTDKENALVVEPHDIEAMADAIVSLFSNKEERERIGSNARKLCNEAFHYGKYGSQMVQQLKDIAKRC